MFVKMKDLDAYIEALEQMRDRTVKLIEAGRALPKPSDSKETKKNYFFWNNKNNKHNTTPVIYSDVEKLNAVLDSKIDMLKTFKENHKNEDSFESSTFEGAHHLFHLLYIPNASIGKEVNYYMLILDHKNDEHDQLESAIELFDAAKKTEAAAYQSIVRSSVAQERGRSVSESFTSPNTVVRGRDNKTF